VDVWIWKQLGERGTALTGYTAHGLYDEFTWDKSDPMSGAADDWAYDHLGVFGWTTEFWDVIKAATGTRGGNDIWYVGPTEEQELGVYQWAVANHPEAYADWVPFDHPQLGPVEIGGWDDIFFWTNAPSTMLAAEVAPHAEFAVFHAMCSPRIEVLNTGVSSLGGNTHRVDVGIANTGWLPTYVTELAKKDRLVLPLVAELTGAEVVRGSNGGHARQELGQLAGRVAQRFHDGKNDGTPDRVLASWVVQGAVGTEVTVAVSHQRAGSQSVTVVL
jgi:hypothetical protein